ncbi:adenosine deaminase-like protein isoform X2 [Cyprinus carpio]|uniref:Adenosine deaminase-like protein isoform X2 n=1 Tax=Cyprinus carpio TaxID=7962 RepID=A0A9Q9VUD8_CYPCA|nr:adenosine deaminase-like protein isoform X2 [Cyprinus carpio]
MVAKTMIQEFAADGVKYLELHSMQREVTETGLTKQRYIETVLEAIRQCKQAEVDIDVRFLVAVDRRHGPEVAMDTVKLAEDFLLSSDGIVVGLDLSGDPTVSHGKDLLSALEKAKNCGLKLVLHLSEVPSQRDESELLLNLPPDRIGHRTFLHPESGGSDSLADKLCKQNIPIESILVCCEQLQKYSWVTKSDKAALHLFNKVSADQFMIGRLFSFHNVALKKTTTRNEW